MPPWAGYRSTSTTWECWQGLGGQPSAYRRELTYTRRRESVKVGAAAGHVLMLAGLLGQWPRSSYAHDVGRGSLSNLVGSSSKGAPVVAAMLYRGFCCLSPAAGPAASYMPAPLALLPLSAAGHSEASAVGVFGGGFLGCWGWFLGGDCSRCLPGVTYKMLRKCC